MTGRRPQRVGGRFSSEIASPPPTLRRPGLPEDATTPCLLSDTGMLENGLSVATGAPYKNMFSPVLLFRLGRSEVLCKFG
eukprot:CAMPEP_0169160610 /NCGR_PEP_ID=MMETSP1015-20121227/56557_1 /TAXON_ID=342587 /ORGANISM="Karlodinium micrum, Strain CCMP2283" /LENGTH=79 /DNA_ID=CAMNT_0009232319 /DNA_START=40 /DNA_END=279 /DNA_ORIENTATION=+